MASIVLRDLPVDEVLDARAMAMVRGGFGWRRFGRGLFELGIGAGMIVGAFASGWFPPAAGALGLFGGLTAGDGVLNIGRAFRE